DIRRMIEEIRAARPDFILNNLIGQTQYLFLQAYAELGREDPHSGPATPPSRPANLPKAHWPPTVPPPRGSSPQVRISAALRTRRFPSASVPRTRQPRTRRSGCWRGFSISARGPRPCRFPPCSRIGARPESASTSAHITRCCLS